MLGNKAFLLLIDNFDAVDFTTVSALDGIIGCNLRSVKYKFLSSLYETVFILKICLLLNPPSLLMLGR